jgi:branched-subunit amino acid aminotransferase/4-amino-4-deoxychorismate lyase
MDRASAYFNGEWITAAELRLPVNDLGFVMGATVTERLRTFRGVVFRPEEHLARLRGSLVIMGLDADSIVNEVGAAISEFVRRNAQLIDRDDDWSIVTFVTPGAAGSRRPTVCVHGHPLPFHTWSAQFETGLPVVVSSVRQVPTNCWPAELKCRSRMHYYLADREAATKQPGARAIVLDQDGFVAEGTTANVIVYRDSEGFVSPPVDYILPGVSLGVVKELAQKLDVPFTMRPLTVEQLSSADEAMLASTSICALPIVECDGRAIGAGQPGPVYRRLLTAWGELVGVDIAEQARRFAGRQ